MAAISGRSLGTGVALGTAAVVRLRNGLPVPPAIPPRVAAQLARHREDETPDIILVAEDYGTAASFAGAIRWGNVVGIAAAYAPPEVAAPSLPIVVDVPSLLEIVQDDMLLVVDGNRSLVLADPDGVTVGQYQAERSNLAPKRRLYLDEGHLRAHTLDGRMMPVAARVYTVEDVSLALENGADGIVVPHDCALLPADAEEEAQRDALFALIQQASGKPLLLNDDYCLPAGLLLEAATKAELSIACPLMPHLEGQGVGERGQELNEARADCLANDMACDMPRLVAELPPDAEVPLDDPDKAAFFMDRLAYNGAARLLLSLDDDAIDHERLAWLDGIVAAANTAMLPVFVQWVLTNFDFSGEAESQNMLEDREKSTLRLLVGAGISGIIVSAGDVSKVKSAVRELNYSECRETLSESLDAWRREMDGTLFTGSGAGKVEEGAGA